MIAKLSELGITSEMAYTAGTASIGLSFVAWVLSKKEEEAGTDRADRWGIFVGQWAPTFFALGIALRLEEGSDLNSTEEVTRAFDGSVLG